ncbi:MAG: glycosyltransferase [Halioglobus sp.]
MTTSTLPRSEYDPEPRFVIDLARALSDRFDITVLAPSFPGAAPRARLFGVDVIYYRYAPLNSWERLAYPGGIMSRLRVSPLSWSLVPWLIVGQAIALRRLLARERYDLIHAHWLVPQGLVAALLPRDLRLPFVVTSHGGDLFTLGRGPFKRLLRFVLGRAAAVTVVSSELFQTVQRLVPERQVNASVHHIPMGVDVAHFAQAARDAPKPADLPTDGQIILFAGRLAQKKGVGVLIDALAATDGPLAKAKLVVIGDGPLRSTLVSYVQNRQLTSRVLFLGARHHGDLPAYMAAADVFVLPSVEAADGDKDGLPVTLIEAAACSLPAVASDIAGVPEFVTDGYNGLLVRPGDSEALRAALQGLLTDAGKRSSLAAAAFRSAKSFDWGVIARRYAQVFEAVLAGSGGALEEVRGVPPVPGTTGKPLASKARTGQS